MKSIIFDLDNTLYPEITYVESGFKSVANYLSAKYDYNSDKLFSKMMEIFDKYGRGKVFDKLIYDLNLDIDVSSLVYVYRYHFPEISLYDDSVDILNKLKKQYKLGLITDGRAFVQKRKVESLNINQFFDVIIFTDILGEDFWKPSVKPFILALDILNSEPHESYYIGDDPYKDFKAPNILGMKSIQIKIEDETKYWKNKGYEKFEADLCINNLKDIISCITNEE